MSHSMKLMEYYSGNFFSKKFKVLLPEEGECWMAKTSTCFLWLPKEGHASLPQLVFLPPDIYGSCHVILLSLSEEVEWMDMNYLCMNEWQIISITISQQQKLAQGHPSDRRKALKFP